MTIKAASIQFNVKQGDVEANLDYVRSALHRASENGAKLAILPEMWSTGFSYKNLNELAKSTCSISDELKRLSQKYSMVIIGSMPEPSGDKVFNTLYLHDNGELIGSYRKLHLFSLLGEDKAFNSGETTFMADTSIGKIGGIICYDLRFPELARKIALDGAQIITVSAEWPKPRQEHWRTLLRARAIENQLFVISCNVCGVIGKLDFFGMSMIIDPKGEVIAEAGEYETEIYGDIDFDAIDAWRRQIPCFNDRRGDIY